MAANIHSFKDLFIYTSFFIDSLGNADGSSGADQSAEMTTYTLGADNTGLTSCSFENDGLMTAVVAGNQATATADTLIVIYLRIDNRVTIQMVGIHKRRQRLTHKFLEFTYATLGHIALNTEQQVIDDTIAILHYGGTQLHIATAQLNKLQCIAPRLDATDAT
jgi:hypothetical protein